MINSLGLGELGLILLVAILFIDPSKVGTVARAFGEFRRKWSRIQRDVKQQFDALALEENLRESVQGVRSAKAALRREAREAVRTMPAAERAAASERILERLREWGPFREAATVAAFCGTRDEVDTEGILRHVLAEGKTLLLPWVTPEPEGRQRLAFSPIRDYDADLTEGVFGLLEPREELRDAVAPEADLILVPGTAFDERGGRLGRGRGFYDRWLEGRAGLRAGVAFEAQIVRKKLALESHDQLLDALVSEDRLLVFSQPASPG